jgi:hypothetical protein
MSRRIDGGGHGPPRRWAGVTLATCYATSRVAVDSRDRRLQLVFADSWPSQGLGDEATPFRMSSLSKSAHESQWAGNLGVRGKARSKALG